MVELIRRSFLVGLGAVLFSAPAIVRATSIMPVKVFSPVNVDEMVAMLERRLEASEQNMARELAQSVYAQTTATPLADLTSQIESAGYWSSAREDFASIVRPARYMRETPKMKRDENTGRWTFA